MNSQVTRDETRAAPAVARPVIVEIIDGGILLITLNRPDRRNAINREVGIAIADALDLLDSDALLRVGVITGTDGFSSGADLNAVLAGEEPRIRDRGFAGIAERGSHKPLIAAVERFALAGGLEVALACDLIVASAGSVLGLPEPTRGLVATGGGVLRLGSRLPHHVAMEVALTGDPITAERAYELGLVSRLTEPGQALDTAVALARRIAANAPLAVLATKEIIDGAREWPPAEAFSRQRDIAAAANRSEDADEGARAFVEKRPPVWRGR